MEKNIQGISTVERDENGYIILDPDSPGFDSL